MKTIAVDFDGVIHSYEKGWQDGSIYGVANVEVIKWMHEKMRNGYAVYIHTSRNPWQVSRWMKKQYPWFGPMAEDCCGGTPVMVVPFWKKFWNRDDFLGVSRRKLPAIIYIDDRGFKFEGQLPPLPTN